MLEVRVKALVYEKLDLTITFFTCTLNISETSLIFYDSTRHSVSICTFQSDFREPINELQSKLYMFTHTFHSKVCVPICRFQSNISMSMNAFQCNICVSIHTFRLTCMYLPVSFKSIIFVSIHTISVQPICVFPYF
jgi:hypothetical protein